MALVKCMDCGTGVSTQAEACPKCGSPVAVSLLAAKHSRPAPAERNATRAVKGILALVLGAIAIAWFNSRPPSEKDGGDSQQDQIQAAPASASSGGVIQVQSAAPATNGQREFEALRTRRLAAYEAGANEIQKSTVFNQANRETADFITRHGTHFSEWSGRMAMLTTSHGGKDAHIKIESPAGVTYRTNDDVPADSPLYKSLGRLREGQQVTFSGILVNKIGQEEGWERSFTERGSLQKPEFSVQFDAIEPR